MALMLRWPLPALLTWAAAWALAFALRAAQAPVWAVLMLPTALGAIATWLPGVAVTTWRRVFVAAGFPLSVAMLGQGTGVPGWVWLVPLALLLLAYPIHAWRDAPVFPTPPGALAQLPLFAPLGASAGVPINARTGASPGTSPDADTAGDVSRAEPPLILDAGCGMGDALVELHRAYPVARIHGVEWSWLWWAVATVRCPWAKVQRGDMWVGSWAPYRLVYLFQRPETMPRAVDKARREMRPGSWLVSLEFEARDEHGRALAPHARLSLEGGRPIWVYRVG